MNSQEFRSKEKIFRGKSVTVSPVYEYVVKIASRCNLNCDYCYEYNQGDHTWRTQPKIMTVETAKIVANRIAEHSNSYNVETVFISLHGGEPLLVGAKHLALLANILRSELDKSGVSVDLIMQTNASLIDTEIAEVIKRFKIKVGISLDGGKNHNDRHRLDHLGNSSHEKVLKGIQVLKSTCPELLSGILTVIDIENDPIEVFDSIAETGILNVDFLLPHFNWDKPPPRSGQQANEYGDWFYSIWKAWIAGRNGNLRIRFLDNLVSRLAGFPGIYEQMSTYPISLVTINTGGDIEGVDTLKSTGDQSQFLGLNLLKDQIDSVFNHPLYIERQAAGEFLSDKCNDCKNKDVCVGGYYPHRFSKINGFNNPSVFCSDLYYLIDKIRFDLKTLPKKDGYAIL